MNDEIQRIADRYKVTPSQVIRKLIKEALIARGVKAPKEL